MQRLVPWVGPLLAATMLVAQQQPPDSAPPQEAAAAKRLAALQAEHKQIVADYQKSARERAEQAKAAKADGKPMPAAIMRPDFGPVVRKAQQEAKEFAGKPEAAPFLVFIVQNGGPDQKAAVAAAITTLSTEHRDSADVAALGQLLPSLERMLDAEQAAAVRDSLAKSNNADVRGWVAFAKHRATIEKAALDGDEYAAAKRELIAAADVASDQQLKGEVRGAIDLREKLGVGNIAPDIEGTDLDGVAFKLSDYKGKVVFLDFWGDW